LGCSQMEINRSMAGASLTAEATCVGEGGGPAAWGGSGPDTRWARLAAGLPVVAARGGAREAPAAGSDRERSPEAWGRTVRTPDV